MTGTRFLDPRILSRISNLELIARTVVDGFISGLHHAPYLGLSTDFAEHRPYLPGDDIRRIDWRVWGRTDRLYVKEFEADTNANLVVLLDISRSMDYGSDAGLTKLDYARYLAASLLYLSRRQRDRVGLITFDTRLVDYVPPAAKHLDLALHTLERAVPGARGDLLGPLEKIGQTVRRRSILVLLSDLYEPPDRILRGLGALRDRGHDLLVFHVLDPHEREFPFEDAASFEDLETGERAPVVPAKMRDAYRAVVREHCETLRRRLGQNRIDYYLADTGRPLDFSLLEYLTRREWLKRVR